MPQRWTPIIPSARSPSDGPSRRHLRCHRRRPCGRLRAFPVGKYVVQIVGERDAPDQAMAASTSGSTRRARRSARRAQALRPAEHNASAQTVEIAQRTLSAICHATGGCRSDSAELHLIPMIADVTVKPPKNGYGKATRSTTCHSNVEPPPPRRSHGLRPPAAAAPAAQPARPVAPAGGFANAPWKR